jgi:hypothetical protein
MPRAALLPSGTSAAPINTCSVDTLHEMLSHHKRAFWPFSWDTGLYYAPVTRPLPARLEAASDSPGHAPRVTSDGYGHALGSFGGFMCAPECL